MASELKVDNISEKTSGNGIALSNSLRLKSYTTSEINALTGMSAGDTVYDSDLGTIKLYNGTDWALMSPSTFATPLDYLVVAGGGGSGVDNPTLGYTGGSGAGGFLTSKDTQGRGMAAASTPSYYLGDSFTITVGAGGAKANKGNNSVFDNITALGGGFPSDSNSEKAGGCGAGASASSVDNTDIGGVGSHGYDGGDNNGANGATAGGGGAGAAGGEPSSSSSQSGANGGIGAVTTILTASTAATASVGEVSSNSVYFSGGGAGSGASSHGTGGLGGGGNGGGNYSGDARTGGGCGGTYAVNVGGSGGSGVVIIRYPATTTLTTIDAGLTYYTYTEGDYKVTIFTAGTGSVTV